MSTTTLVNAEQFWDLPDDGVRRELVRGELIEMTPAGYRHGSIIGRLAHSLIAFVKEHKLGDVAVAETGFLLSRDPDTVLAPDLAFVRQSRIDQVGFPQKFFPGPPDLAVEVLSPSDSLSKADAKAREWLAHGTLAVWVVDPQRRTVTVYRAGQDAKTIAEDELLESPDLLPGFGVQVGSFLV